MRGLEVGARRADTTGMGDERAPATGGARWHPRDRSRADAMGLALVVLGVALHASLLALLGPAPSGLWFQGAVLVGQVLGVVVLALLRTRLPAAFWAVVTIGVTPLVASVAPLYPQATLVVLPIVFLLVLFTSSTLSRTVARVVAVEGLVVAAFVIVEDPTGRDLMAAELFFVVGTLAVIHVLLVRSADAQAELVGRLERAARIDPLTGLLARRAFEELVADELGAGRTTALVVVDVDRFKWVNDTHGHIAGDAALQQVARALTSGVRAGDAVAGRLGGDEFAVLLRSCSPDVARRRADELVTAVADRPVQLPAGDVVALGVSVGVATADDGDVATLYAAADAALYAAKAAGRGRAVVATGATTPR